MKKQHLFFLALGLTVVLLTGNAMIARNGLRPIISEEHIFDETQIEEGGVPPMVAFTTMALGGFRGLLADILWMRALDLQDKGQYFEMVQLADWIQKLQPKLAQVSSFLGWNMAYNISVACKDFDTRWRWVHRGMEALQDAIRMSPNDPYIYYQLAWIYQHKLGNTLDDAQQYYKIELAKVMMHIFGGQHYPNWKKIQEFSMSNKEFQALYPADSPVWKIVHDAGYADLESLKKDFNALGNLPEKLAEKLSEKDKESFENFLRASFMKEKHLLDPKVVFEVEEKYGNLDWFLPESWAIYWAHQGILHSQDRTNQDCERVIVQSLGVSFQNGHMLISKKGLENRFFILVPNFNLIESIKKMYLDVIKQNPDTLSFKHAYRGYMAHVVELLYYYGQKVKAQEYFDMMKKEKMPEANNLTMEQFVLKRWQKSIQDSGFKVKMQLLTGMLTQAAYMLAYGDYEAQESFTMLAKLAYESHARDIGAQDRQKFKPFTEMQKEVIENLMNVMPDDLALALQGELENLKNEKNRFNQENGVAQQQEESKKN